MLAAFQRQKRLALQEKKDERDEGASSFSSSSSPPPLSITQRTATTSPHALPSLALNERGGGGERPQAPGSEVCMKSLDLPSPSQAGRSRGVLLGEPKRSEGGEKVDEGMPHSKTRARNAHLRRLSSYPGILEQRMHANQERERKERRPSEAAKKIVTEIHKSLGVGVEATLSGVCTRPDRERERDKEKTDREGGSSSLDTS